MPIVEPAHPLHAHALAPKMREADKQEVWAGMGASPLAALQESMECSEESYGIWHEESLVALFGLSTGPNGEFGIPWLLGSEELVDIQMWFLRRFSRQWSDYFNDQYPLLANVVDARNTVHIEWLKWSGYTFINYHESFGHEGLPFYEFVRIK